MDTLRGGTETSTDVIDPNSNLIQLDRGKGTRRHGALLFLAPSSSAAGPWSVFLFLCVCVQCAVCVWMQASSHHFPFPLLHPINAGLFSLLITFFSSSFFLLLFFSCFSTSQKSLFSQTPFLTHSLLPHSLSLSHSHPFPSLASFLNHFHITKTLCS